MVNEFEPFEPKIDKYGVISCPQCECYNIHIIKTMSTLQDVEAFHLDIVKPEGEKESSKIELIHEVLEKGGYDYSIDLHYKCESGCKGVIRINHHEGNTFLLHKKHE